MSFSEVSHIRFLMRQQCVNQSDNNVLFLHIFSHWVFWSFNEAFICHGIRPRGSVKNSSIRGLMGSYHICHGGYHICPESIYIKGPDVYVNWLMKRWLSSYTCAMCCSCRWERETGSICNFYAPLSWDREWENGSTNPWIGRFSTIRFVDPSRKMRGEDVKW
jgi:hypothetical protein